MTMKSHYDQRHTARFFEVGGYLRSIPRSKPGIVIPMVILPKYGPLYAVRFQILERVGESAYELDILHH